jgi:hypothetical protein
MQSGVDVQLIQHNRVAFLRQQATLIRATLTEQIENAARTSFEATPTGPLCGEDYC